MNVKNDVTELIGSTPLFDVSDIVGGEAKVYAKLELFNPGGSVKDRVAASMVADAENSGVLKPGATIIEPTSGNTGVALAAIAAARGYHMILTMPETMSVERRRLAAAYGAEIVLTPGADGMKGAIAKADELVAATPGAWLAGQFTNPANPAAHYATTGPEIWNDTDGEVDAFIAGAGTGGTMSGVGKFLKEKKPEVKIVVVEPATSPVITEGHGGPHQIQGIGAGFIPETLDTDVFDEALTVEGADAFEFSRRMAREKGVLVGISSGAALKAAAELSARSDFAGKTIVTLLPDTGERYLSTDLFA